MKKSELPQDGGALDKSNYKELCYVTDKDGNYVTGKSSGWKPKKIALDNAIEEINDRIKQAKQQVLEGKISPIVYYMELNKMDVSILSSYVGMWTWRVKRHFKVNVFSKLSERILLKYATVFSISIEELKDIEFGN